MSSLLDDEDIASKIKLHIMGVAADQGHFRADTIVDFIASKAMQAKLEKKVQNPHKVGEEGLDDPEFDFVE
ncbi:hypothetical protein B0H14DRAFT_3453147 [Mycena olivaceomarginata]|nr:hypothetical protein B0H14DRAFT_3453147 [Mycena olivaceomarginata]